MEKYQKTTSEQSEWGALFLPRNKKMLHPQALRIAVFASTTAGELLLDSLTRFERKFPGKLALVGLATDDPLDPKTRISVQKRIWHHYSSQEMKIMVNQIIDTSINHDIPCYTGNVKTDYFRKIFLEWNPDAVIMCCFGQKIDAFIYTYPAFGMYNFHPSDLAARIGAGAKPFQSTMSNGSQTSVMTIHQVTETIDVGPIVGFSPRIRISREDDSYPDDVRNLQEKIPSVCGWMGIILVEKLLEQKLASKPLAIESIDFQSAMLPTLGDKLMQPVDEDLTRYKLPLHPSIR